MSHISKLKFPIDNLDALIKGAERRGLEKRDKTNYNWFGKNGQKNKCDFVLGIKGKPAGYEIGVKRNADGTYEMEVDYYDRTLANLIGVPNEKRWGSVDNMDLLLQDYAVEKAKSEAMDLGYRVEEYQNEEGETVIRVMS